MCGITACISQNCVQILLNGLVQLQNRGYDSAGITTLVSSGNSLDHDFITTKFASDEETALIKLERYKNEHFNSKIGIAHTRWATHGPKTDINSHPHISYNGNFALVHNGIIENYKDLKDQLSQNNINCISETDSEVIVNLLDFYYQSLSSCIKSLKYVLSLLQGTWGLVILCKDEPNTLYCSRKGSPLLVGEHSNMAIVASEQSAFCNKLNNYIALNNQDICTISLEGEKIRIVTNDIHTKIHTRNLSSEFLSDTYKFWTEKEIYEQVDSSLRAISFGARLLSTGKVKLGGLESHQEQLIEIDNMVLLGCGTSYFAGLCGKRYFKSLCDFNTVQVIDGAEFEMNDIPKKGKTALLFLSQSGETKDLYRCLEMTKDTDIIKIGVVNVVDSLLAREVDCGCYLNAGREIGVASTKSFTSQVIILSMMAIWFAQIKNINLNKRTIYIQDLRKLHLDIEQTIKNCDIDGLLPLFKDQNNCFILGKKIGHAIACEAALKIKELSYIHAEGYSSSSLKHGPFALLKKDFPVILIAPMNTYFSKNMNAYEEMKSRHANVIIVTNNTELDLPNTVLTANNDSYNELLCLIPLQLLAFKLSLYRGYNPDLPRNLAKVVTVE